MALSIILQAKPHRFFFKTGIQQETQHLLKTHFLFVYTKQLYYIENIYLLQESPQLPL